MELFWKAASAVLLSAVLTLTLGKQERDIGLLLTMTVCCMVGMIAASFLEPVLDLLYELEALTSLDGDMLKTLFKLVGIGLVAEIAAVICADAGCGSLGKTLQLLSSAVILYLSIPIFRQLVSLIREIFGNL